MKRKYPAQIFKAYDIRGIVDTELTNAVIEDIGKVLGTLAQAAQAKGLVVGYDGRLSSPELSKHLVAGILSSGCDVFDIGEVTTPMVYFANYHLETFSGVMITGSHNPPEYNGLKMVIGGTTLSGPDIQDILRRLEDSDYISDKAGIYKAIDITEDYVEKIVGDVKLKRQMSIIVDCGNGVAGKIAPKLYRRMGAKVLGLFCDVDGNFPNHHPDPSQVANLKDLIDALKNPGAEVGLAFDGDGDRLGVVTRDGKIVYPDRQMMIFVADVLEKNPGSKIIYDVKSSRLLANWIKEHGGEPIMCRTGHSFIKAKIKETGALLAGEMSGHIFFNDRWYGADDGVYAGARLLEILSQLDDPTILLDALPEAVSTPELNIKVSEGEQHTIIEKLQKTAKFKTSTSISTLDGLRVEYDDGFGLVRASNTTPVLVLRFEADTEDGLKRIQGEFRKVLSPVVKEIGF
ncbi:MAG: phosphoglucomutase [Burkholderiales bacterium]|jgi:phosphomannomutase/phosphoglucomutase|nr:phosphoglucomutase [Burkholderiales bacterium]